MVLSKMNDTLNKITDVVNKCLGPLGSNNATWGDYLIDIVIQLCATLILFLVIRFFIWKRITKILEARRDAIDKELDEAKKENDWARATSADIQSKLDKAQAEIKEMLEKAEKEANLRREEILVEAHKEAENKIKKAEAEIELEIQKKNTEIHEQIVEIAMQAASKIVGHEVDQNKDLDLVNEIIEGASK